ncbi:MAG: DMT family transporter [Paracoccaceae bacterium]
MYGGRVHVNGGHDDSQTDGLENIHTFVGCGRSVSAPLETTAVNFLFTAPFGVFLWVLFPAGAAVSTSGVLLAIASGSLASGVGYALWYSVLPKLESTLAAIFQLSVPIIALAGGVLFLGEAVTLSFAISAGLIMAGVLVAVRK